jgi:Rap1a immunity proteins
MKIRFAVLAVACLFSLLLSRGASFAEDDRYLESANHQMPACRDFINRDSDTSPLLQGYCVGTIATFIAFGRHVGTHCAPRDVSTRQGIQVVIQYIDSQPARLHEKFGLLAVEVMQKAWPCR